jgi:hypothetical protein
VRSPRTTAVIQRRDEAQQACAAGPSPQGVAQLRDPVQRVRVGPGAARLAPVEPGERGHVLLGELEVEQREVLAHPLAPRRLREDDVAALEVPAEGDLGRRTAEAGGDSLDHRWPTTWPLAIGDHASVATPCLALAPRAVSLGKKGCASIWLTAGTTPVSATIRSRWPGWKLETPMERVRPASRSSTRVSQVETKSPS